MIWNLNVAGYATILSRSLNRMALVKMVFAGDSRLYKESRLKVGAESSSQLNRKQRKKIKDFS